MDPGQPAPPPDFLRVDVAAGPYPGALRIADLNRDGALDAVLANTYRDTITVLIGDGRGGLLARPPFPGGGGGYLFSIAVGDVNGDNNPDLITADLAVSIHLGAGDGTFSIGSQYADLLPVWVAERDLTGDGVLDLAVVSRQQNSVRLLMGDGRGRFSALTDLLSGERPQFALIQDVNGDGLHDLLVANWNGSSVSRFLGTGGGSLGPRADFPIGDRPQALVVLDVDRDGLPDVLVSGYGRNQVFVLRNLGGAEAGLAQPPQGYPVGASPAGLAAGDVDGDGLPELLVANVNSDSVSLLDADGRGGLRPRAEYPTGANPTSVAIADMNGDGANDFVVTNQSGDSVSLFLRVPASP